MFHGSTTADMQIHDRRLHEQLEKSGKRHALLCNADVPAKQPSSIKRFAARLSATSTRRNLAPQN